MVAWTTPHSVYEIIEGCWTETKDQRESHLPAPVNWWHEDVEREVNLDVRRPGNFRQDVQHVVAVDVWPPRE